MKAVARTMGKRERRGNKIKGSADVLGATNINEVQKLNLLRGGEELGISTIFSYL